MCTLDRNILMIQTMLPGCANKHLQTCECHSILSIQQHQDRQHTWTVFSEIVRVDLQGQVQECQQQHSTAHSVKSVPPDACPVAQAVRVRPDAQ